MAFTHIGGFDVHCEFLKALPSSQSTCSPVFIAQLSLGAIKWFLGQPATHYLTHSICSRGAVEGPRSPNPLRARDFPATPYHYGRLRVVVRTMS